MISMAGKAIRRWWALFVLPTFAAFVIGFVVPFIYGIYLSFCKFSTVTDAQFTQTDLEFQWMAMCNRMPQKLSGIATRMKNMNPEITEFPTVEVVVDNELIKQEIEDIQKSIAKTLQVYLHNNQIQITVRVAEQTEHVKILSRREQFEQMAACLYLQRSCTSHALTFSLLCRVYL